MPAHRAYVVAQYIERSRAQSAQPPIGGGQTQPSGGEYAEEMTVTEEDGPAVDRRGPIDEPVGPDSDRATDSPPATVPEHVPARLLPADLLGRQPFLLAVVPFQEVRIDPGLFPNPASSQVRLAAASG